MKIETVAIIGLGALGILYGNHFTKAIGKDRVRIVVNKERMARYQEQGISFNGEPCDFQYVDEKDASLESADLVILAVKGTQLDDAIETARNQVGPDTTIISVLNGISSEEVIGAAFGGEKIVHCVAQGMDALRTGNDVKSVHIGELRIGILPSFSAGVAASAIQRTRDLLLGVPVLGGSLAAIGYVLVSWLWRWQTLRRRHK